MATSSLPSSDALIVFKVLDRTVPTSILMATNLFNDSILGNAVHNTHRHRQTHINTYRHRHTQTHTYTHTLLYKRML